MLSPTGMSEAEGRPAIVAEALTWRGTPYHHEGRIKGVGVDCGMLIAEVYEQAGVIPHVEVDRYPPDRHLHVSSEDYLAIILRYGHQVDIGKPGDVGMWKFGKTRSHGAIIIEWPIVIHATLRERKVWVCDVSKDLRYNSQKPLFYSLW